MAGTRSLVTEQETGKIREQKIIGSVIGADGSQDILFPIQG